MNYFISRIFEFPVHDFQGWNFGLLDVKKVSQLKARLRIALNIKTGLLEGWAKLSSIAYVSLLSLYCMPTHLSNVLGRTFAEC